mmetsp:Transcript_43916/g.121623  ORF Transcript_43916/g.121623 Transcript_43916/m.121623 type:complete len:251 (+) Transcript_43916:171-923(+)
MRPAYTRASPPSPALSIEQRGGALLQALAGRADQAEDVALVFVAELLLRVDVLQHAAAPHAEGAVRDEVVETQVRSRHVPEDEGGGVVRPLLRDVGRVAVRLLHHLHPAVKVDAARRAWLPKPHRQARDHLDQADRALRLHAVPPHVPLCAPACRTVTRSRGRTVTPSHRHTPSCGHVMWACDERLGRGRTSYWKRWLGACEWQRHVPSRAESGSVPSSASWSASGFGVSKRSRQAAGSEADRKVCEAAS